VTRPALCLAALLAALANGCGGEAPREGGAGEPGPSTPAPSTITEADSGETFTLAPGSETSLQLSGQYVWSEPTVRGDAVQLTRVEYFQDPGFSEWMVSAVQPGTATIAARGTPDCAGQAGCPEAPLRVQLEITVAP
jgi:predicted secreted protein